jgi:hypothetical protein
LIAFAAFALFDFTTFPGLLACFLKLPWAILAQCCLFAKSDDLMKGSCAFICVRFFPVARIFCLLCLWCCCLVARGDPAFSSSLCFSFILLFLFFFQLIRAGAFLFSLFSFFCSASSRFLSLAVSLPRSWSDDERARSGTETNSFPHKYVRFYKKGHGYRIQELFFMYTHTNTDLSPTIRGTFVAARPWVRSPSTRQLKRLHDLFVSLALSPLHSIK